jgi:hypothetical protein
MLKTFTGISVKDLCLESERHEYCNAAHSIQQMLGKKPQVRQK